jgi:hypothetical protein
MHVNQMQMIHVVQMKCVSVMLITLPRAYHSVIPVTQMPALMSGFALRLQAENMSAALSVI